MKSEHGIIDAEFFNVIYAAGAAMGRWQTAVYDLHQASMAYTMVQNKLNRANAACVALNKKFEDTQKEFFARDDGDKTAWQEVELALTRQQTLLQIEQHSFKRAEARLKFMTERSHRAEAEHAICSAKIVEMRFWDHLDDMKKISWGSHMALV